MRLVRHHPLRGFAGAAGAMSAAILLLCAGTATAGQDDLASPALRIDWTSFKKLYDARKVIVIDVRDAASYNTGHIPGARSIPLNKIDESIADLKKIKKPIVLYCA